MSPLYDHDLTTYSVLLHTLNYVFYSTKARLQSTSVHCEIYRLSALDLLLTYLIMFQLL